jgi:hypothetical protein
MWEWPCRLLLGYPYEVSSRVRFQMMRVLSREPERSMFGLAIPSVRCRTVFPTAGNSLLERGGQGGDPAIMALKGAAENQLLGHGV